MFWDSRIPQFVQTDCNFAKAPHVQHLMSDVKFNSTDSRVVGQVLNQIEDSEDERMAALDNVFGRDSDFRHLCAVQFTLGVAQATIAGKNMDIEILKRQIERDTESDEWMFGFGIDEVYGGVGFDDG